MQYPDAPNLFTNVRRPYRPDVWTEFSRTWLISVIGIALVATGIVMLVYNEVSKTDNEFSILRKSRQGKSL